MYEEEVYDYDYDESIDFFLFLLISLYELSGSYSDVSYFLSIFLCGFTAPINL